MTNAQCDSAFRELEQDNEQKFLKENGSGSKEYDWDKIEEWLKQDADTIPNMEYLAFVNLMSEMPDGDLGKLFHIAQINMSPFDNRFCDASKVMQEAANRYLLIAQIDAELTIFDEHSRYDYDEVKITNQLGKAFLIHYVLNNIMYNGAGKRHYVTISSEEYKGKLTYMADISVAAATSSYGSAESNLGEILVSDAAKRQIRVNPWGTTATAQDDLNDCEEMTFYSLMPSYQETLGDAAQSQIAGYAAERLGEMLLDGAGSMLSSSLTATEIMLELKENYENTVAINGALDMIYTRRAVQALDIQAGVVSVTGPTENTAYLICAKYDPEELLIRVAAYNSEHDQKTSVAEIKDAFANSDTDTDAKQLLDGYMRWFFEGGDGAIEKYWSELIEVSQDYYAQNPQINQINVKKMSIIQLQELIKKQEDPSYEINIEVMVE